MSFIERKDAIIDFIKTKDGHCTITEVCSHLYASRSTIRRDLIMLEEEGLITRHHGSISMISDSASENSSSARIIKNPLEKALIAKIAASILHDNMVIFLDSSSTVSNLCPIIKKFNNITVITNGLNIANQLSTATNIKCYICPGKLKLKSLSIVGEYSSEFLNYFKADAVFLSSKAIHPDGIYEGDDSQAICKKHMLRNAAKSILMCDNSKETANAYFKLADYKDIDILVTNGPLSPELTAVVTAANCEIMAPADLN